MFEERIDLMIESNKGQSMKDIAKELGVEQIGTFWITLDPNSQEKVEKVIEYHNKGLISILMGNFGQKLNSNLTDWFLLSPTKIFDWESFDEYPTCKAERITKGHHLGYLWGSIYFSEKLKEVVEKSHLTGLDFLWIKDKSRYKAMQWYLAIAQEPMGRGIDHEWFSGSPKGGGYAQPTGSFRNGIHVFDNDQLGNPILNDPKYKLFSIIKPGKLHLLTTPTFNRNYLPNKDFAFLWLEEDRENSKKSYGGEIVRKSRKVCLNKKAVDILLQSKLITEKDISALRILDEVPPGKENLDVIQPLPKPFFYGQWEEVKKVEKELLESFHSKPKPERIVEFSKAIKQLKQAVKDRKEDFKKGASKKDLLLLSIPNFPTQWMEVFKISNGGSLAPNLECEIIDCKSLIEFNNETDKWYEGYEQRKPKNFFHICHSPSGDFYSLDLTTSNGVDAKVVLTSHETLEAERTWDSIAIFIDDMLNQF